MNAREGMRRLAFVLGVAGSLTGAVFGYQNARDVWNARSAHKRFESLVTTPAIQKDLKKVVDTIQKGRSENLWFPIPQNQKSLPQSLSPEEILPSLSPEELLQGQVAPEKPPEHQKLPEEERKKLDSIVDRMIDRGEPRDKIQNAVDQYKKAYVLSTLSDEQLQVYKNLLENTPSGERQKLARFDRKADGDGIDQFTVDPSTSTVTSIQLSTGELLSRTPPPTLVAWIALPLYPLIGFLLPWGAVRLLTWVGAGFFSKQLG